MKKLFLVLASVALMWSCSNEEEATLMNESSAINNNSMYQRAPTLEEMYADMIISQEYQDYDIALNSFIGKMNFTGSKADLASSTTLLDWIHTNISTTSFTDYAEASGKWDDIADLHGIVLQNHMGFFEAIDKEGPGRILDLIDPVNPVESNGCPGCLAPFLSCVGDVASDYAGTYELQLGTYLSGGSTQQAYSAAYAVNRAGYAIGMTICRDNFDACCV